jgi:hypothetical protein
LKETHFVDSYNGANHTGFSNVALKVLTCPFQPIQNRRSGSRLRSKPIFWHIYSIDKKIRINVYIFIENIVVPSRVSKLRAQSLAALNADLPAIASRVRAPGHLQR